MGAEVVVEIDEHGSRKVPRLVRATPSARLTEIPANIPNGDATLGDGLGERGG
jgi:hypothetical protein